MNGSKNKRILGGVLPALMLLSCAGTVFGGAFDGFSQFASQPALKPFCRDLGGILGAGTFSTGRVLGFSGFELGGHEMVQYQPDKNDSIIRDQNGAKPIVGIPIVQGEVGMPFRMDGYVRGGGFEGLTVAGGGVRYGLIKVVDTPWSPQLLATTDDEAAVHNDFSANHLGASLVGSMGTHAFKPYVGAGFDWTTLTVRSAQDTTLDGASVTTFEGRFTAGIGVMPWNFVYIHAAYVLLHGMSGSEAGMGIRF